MIMYTAETGTIGIDGIRNVAKGEIFVALEEAQAWYDRQNIEADWKLEKDCSSNSLANVSSCYKSLTVVECDEAGDVVGRIYGVSDLYEEYGYDQYMREVAS